MATDYTVISGPGDLNDLVLALADLADGETVSTIIESTADDPLIVENAAASVDAYVVDGTTYAAGEAITFDLRVADSVVSKECWVYFDYDTSGGERFRKKHRVKIVNYVQVP